MIITLSSSSGGDDELDVLLLRPLGDLAVKAGKHLRRPIWKYAGVHPEEVDPASDPGELGESDSDLRDPGPITVEDLRCNTWLSDDKAYQEELREWAEG